VHAVSERVSFRAVYERFPTTVKGAFVLRGADGLPHQVRIEAARAAECSGRGHQPIAIESTIVEAAPTVDTFVPFEVSTMELAAGWYRLECEVVIDGDASVIHPGAPFSIPWPRGAVRRGTVELERGVGDLTLSVMECGGDSVRVTYVAEHAPNVRLTVDGATHPIVEIDHDEHAGTGRIVAYPVLRTQERLAIELRGEKPVDVTLP
jgi:hypothetical protein